MLGFDSYSKSIIGSIVEQRIRLFLTKRKIINIPVFKTVSKSDIATIGPIGDKLFKSFKAETADLFYYYAFSSILLNTPDYNFLINDDAESLKKAEDNLRDMFNKILLDFFEGESTDQNNQGGQVDNSNLFNFIKDPKYQRDLPPFKAKLTKKQLAAQNVKDNALPLFADVLSKNFDGKQKLIYEMPQPFYVDFFYRSKTDDPLLKYLSSGDGYESTTADPTVPFPVTNKDLFNRGARLMFNLTSGITQPTDAADNVGDFNYYSLKPSRFLPFFSLQTNNSSPSKFVKDYPLPFLSTNVPKKVGKSGAVETTNSPTFGESSVGVAPAQDKPPPHAPTFLYGVVRKIQQGKSSKNLKTDSAHWIRDDAGYGFKEGFVTGSDAADPSDLDKHYFYALKNAVDVGTLNYPKSFKWNELMWSKSLVCFDYLPNSNPPEMYAYFPMIIAEYVSESGEGDVTIINKLLETEEVKLFNNLIEKEKISEQPTSLVQIIIDNETVSSGKSNISLLFDNTTIKIQEEKLDNMLLKLINFDEET